MAACGLALASSPAHAGAGAWSNEKGIKHLHFEFGPIDVKPGQNDATNVTVPQTAMPKINGYIMRMKPNLQYMDGSVPRVDVLHLHHGVWLNLSRQSDTSPFQPLEPIFFAGEEKTVFNIPKGYGYEYLAGSTWILNHMIHNNTPNATKVKLVWDLDMIPLTSPLAKKVKPVEPLWMDVRRGWGYPVFDVLRDTGSGGTYTFPDQAPSDPYAGRTIQNEFKMPWSGTIVSAVGHLHPGGLKDDIDLIRPGAKLPAGSACRSVAANIRGTKMRRSCVKATAGSKPSSVRIFRSQAKYYDRAGPVSWDVSLTASRPDWRVKVNTGDTLRITTTYDSARGAWYEAMGIVMLYVAKGERKGVDPFKQPVDWGGVLTHGHLPENDNHGGGAGVLADPRNVPDGPVPGKIEIKNFQFSPGDLGPARKRRARADRQPGSEPSVREPGSGDVRLALDHRVRGSVQRGDGHLVSARGRPVADAVRLRPARLRIEGAHAGDEQADLRHAGDPAGRHLHVFLPRSQLHARRLPCEVVSSRRPPRSSHLDRLVDVHAAA